MAGLFNYLISKKLDSFLRKMLNSVRRSRKMGNSVINEFRDSNYAALHPKNQADREFLKEQLVVTQRCLSPCKMELF